MSETDFASIDDVLAGISDAVYEGDRQRIEDLTRRALDANAAAQDILSRGLMPGMERVGVDFRDGTMFIPEVISSAQTMHASMEILRPVFTETGVKAVGTLLIGTVQGDIHDIGKNLVGMMCEGTGFKVIDLGVDVAPERFIEGIEVESPDIVGMSALLTTTTKSMQAAIESLEKAGVRKAVKVIVGGAPVQPDFAEAIGADGYAPNALAAASLAKSLLE